MKTILYILLSLMTLSFASCDREDDINEIFNGKKWYMKSFVANGKENNKEEKRKGEQHQTEHARE